MKNNIRKTVLSAVFCALALLLPFVTGQVQQLGRMLCPMHIPVMLCGLICGASWGAAVGAVSPLLRSLIFGMPVFYPEAVSMCVELAVYGAVAGFMYNRLGKSKSSIYAALLVSMLAGRFAWGAARFALGKLNATPLTFGVFISSGFTTAIPGIICQLVVIPPIVMLFERAISSKRRTL